MEESFALLLTFFVANTMALYPFTTTLGDERIPTTPGDQRLPTTPFNGYRFLKYRPTTEYRHIPSIDWIKNVNDVTEEDVEKLRDEIIKQGVVKIPNQKLTRTQQIIFSERLGEVIIIPKSFRGNHVLPDFPNIVPVSNFWCNGTWKGRFHSFGQYWHKDGDYFTFEKGYMFSMLYADQYDQDIVGGETAFINGCTLRRHLPKDIEKHLRNANISLHPRDIPDFRAEGSEEDLNSFPRVSHRVIFKHPDKQEECIFLRYADDMNATDATTVSMLRLWDYMQSPGYIMKQSWSQGDVVIWDNYGVFHRAMPFVNSEKKRIMYRTQIRMTARTKSGGRV